MLFESNRDIVVRSLRGHAIEFKKGVPTLVPRIMHEEVMEKGIIPVSEDDGKKIDPVKADVGEKKPKIFLAPDDQMERNDAILEVIKAIVVRNNSKDFTGGNVPSAAAVSTGLGWKTDQKEVRTVWEKVREELLRQ